MSEHQRVIFQRFHEDSLCVDVVHVFPDASIHSEVSGRDSLPVFLSFIKAGSHFSSSHVGMNICRLEFIKHLLVLVIVRGVVRRIFNSKRSLVSNSILGVSAALTTALDHFLAESFEPKALPTSS